MSGSQYQQRSYYNFAIGGGIGGGVGAYVVGFALMFVAKSGAVQSQMGQVIGQLAGTGVQPPGTHQVIGWVFYASHNVGSSVRAGGFNQALPITQGGPIWEVWFLLVPPVLLIVAGYLVASITVSHDPTHGAQAGASVVLGYLPLALLGALVVTWSGTTQGVSFAVGPSLAMAAIVAGIVYPVVFGGIGGAIAGGT